MERDDRLETSGLTWPVAMTVEAGKVVEFARALRAEDPRYVELGGPGGSGDLIAPVTFPAVLNHWGVSGRDILRDLGCPLDRALHGEESYVYANGPLHAGQRLVGDVRLVGRDEKQRPNHQPMTAWRLRTELRDADTQQVAVTIDRIVLQLGR